MTATARAVELAKIAAEAAAEKLAADIIAYDVSEQLVITDVFLLCSAANDRQVRAIVDEIGWAPASASSPPTGLSQRNCLPGRRRASSDRRREWRHAE